MLSTSSSLSSIMGSSFGTSEDFHENSSRDGASSSGTSEYFHANSRSEGASCSSNGFIACLSSFAIVMDR
ncbi:hypothetical protein ACOSP7_016415 [Xanthoceras sorbifolium]